MGNCHFNGPIPSSIGNLTRLKAFSIWGNNINSSIPKELSQLVNLKLLNLHDANMYGSLPKEFGRMQYMKNLSLQSNFFTGTIPEAWMTMVNIEHLSAFNNHLSGDLPAWLSNISMKVNVGCNYFTGRKPTGFPAIDIVGNCFDGLDDHAIACKGSSSCVSFYSTTQNGDSSDRHTLVAIVSSVASILIVVGIFGAYCAWRKRNKAWQDTHGSLQDAPEDFEIGLWQVQSNVQKYSLTEILRITENFSQKNEIGFGGFGRVYKGYLDSECIVAVKRAFPSRAHGQMQFHNEVALLSRLHHKCLVRLMGYCNEAREQILVFEYLKNGNLNSLMWAEEKKQTLTWYKRIEIALAIAQGLDYLHSFVDPPIIHRDVKPSNILLDDYFCAKLADFGISRTTTDIGATHISTTPAGTIGYVDPQYLLQHHLTTSSDVYSYGVVLLVLLTGQKAVDDLRVEESNLVEWVKIKYREADLQSIIDPCLQHHLSMHDPHQKRSRTAIELALKCTAFERSTRPSMKVVVETLDNILNEEDKKGELLSFQSLLSLSHRTSPNFTSEASSSGVQTSSHTC